MCDKAQEETRTYGEMMPQSIEMIRADDRIIASGMSRSEMQRWKKKR